MIRGAIETIDDQHIQGWVYSPIAPVRGLKLLAFHGNRCAGAGVVDIFRADLVAAGLGDGFGGFRFGYSLRPGEYARRLTLRFENSDFDLLQRHMIILPEEEFAPLDAKQEG